MAKEEINQSTHLVLYTETFIIKQSKDCIFEGGITKKTGTFQGHSEYLLTRAFPAPFVNNLDFDVSATVVGFHSDKDHNTYYDTDTIVYTYTSFGLRVRLSKGIKGVRVTVKALGYVKENDLYTPKPELRILGRPVYDQSQALPVKNLKINRGTNKPRKKAI